MNPQIDGQPPAQRAIAEQLALVRAIGANALTVATMSARAVFGLLTARLFGGSVLGAFALAATWLDLLSQLAVLGLDSAAMIRAAQAHSQGDMAAVRRVFRDALRMALLVSSLIATGVIAIASTGWLERLSGARGFEPLVMILAVSIPAVAVSRVSAQVARGLQVVSNDLYAQGALGTAVMLLTLIAGYALGLDATGPAVATTLGAIVAGVAAWWLTARAISSADAPVAPVRADASRGLVQFSLPIAANQFVDVLATRVDVLLLGMFVNRIDGLTIMTLGIYAAVAEVAGLLRKFRQVFGLALTPAAARRDRVDPGTSAYAGQVSRWLLALIGPAVFVLILASGGILSLYGPGFSHGASWLGVLAVGAGVQAIMVALDSLLIVKRPALNLLNGVAAVAAQAGLSLLLIPRYGPPGAALAAVAAIAIEAAMLIVEIRSIEGWWWPWPAMRRPALAIAGALVPSLLVRLAWPGSMGGVMAAAIFLTAYVLMWRWVRLDAEDRVLIKMIRGQLPVR